jgi:hypothetical protein
MNKVRTIEGAHTAPEVAPDALLIPMKPTMARTKPSMDQEIWPTPSTSSTQVVYDEPTKGEEDDDSSPENPLVLLGSSLDHAYRVAADAQGVGYAVQAPLGAFEHLSLLAQIAQDGPAAVEKLVELVRCVLKEGVFAQHAAFAVVLASLHSSSRVCIGPVGRCGVVGLGGRKRRVGGSCCAGVGHGIRVFGRGGVVWAATKQFGARFGCLLSMACQSQSAPEVLGSVRVSSLGRRRPRDTYHVLVRALDALEAVSVFFQFAPERL